MRSARPSMQRHIFMKRAFTLIELLVVIAIIAILAAILFPVFAQAKMAAKKTGSVSNIKQNAMGILMYNNDNDGVYSWAQPGGWQWTQDWIMNTQPYIKSFQLLLAPTDPGQRPTWSGPPYSYAANGIVCWDWQKGGWMVHGLFNERQSWHLNYQDSFSETSVGLPAETILLGERQSMKAYNQELTGAWDLNFVTFRGWDFDLPGQGPLGTDQWVKPTNKPGSMAVPYAGSSTFAFADGHAAAMNPIKSISGSAYNNGNCDSGFFKYWDAQRTQ